MKSFYRYFRLSTLTLLAAIVLAQTAAGRDLVKKVVFPKGKNTVTYRGKLPGRYADYHAYTIKLKKGQRLTVKLTTADADASFSIYETKQLGPDEDLIFDSKPDYRQYSGLAPITSEYSIQIYGVKDIDDQPSRSAYTVEITVLTAS